LVNRGNKTEMWRKRERAYQGTLKFPEGEQAERGGAVCDARQGGHEKNGNVCRKDFASLKELRGLPLGTKRYE